MAAALAYKRVVLKISGGAFGAPDGAALDAERVAFVAREVAAAAAAGAEVAVVTGGGNVVRGRAAGDWGWPRVAVDYMGMLATVINGLALKEALGSLGRDAALLAADDYGECAERYRRERAWELLASGAVVLFVGGTGRPFVTTDTAAALRAAEIDADAFLKATDVDGVYDRDPRADGRAVRYDRLSFDDVLAKGLGVMDAAAAALCRDRKIPAVVFRLYNEGNIVKIIRGETVGTRVT